MGVIFLSTTRPEIVATSQQPQKHHHPLAGRRIPRPKSRPGQQYPLATREANDTQQRHVVQSP
jgi:hypothetical protein